MEKPIVKIKLLPGGKMPVKKTEGAAAYDCYARIDKNDLFYSNEIDAIFVDRTPRLLPLGFALELPPGYHAEIYPRSSIGLKTKLRMANSVGIIDSDFRGEVNFVGEAKNGGVWIGNGQRIAQMIIKKNEDVEFVQVDELSETERGTGGFGSTGK